MEFNISPKSIDSLIVSRCKRLPGIEVNSSDNTEWKTRNTEATSEFNEPQFIIQWIHNY